MRKQLLAGLLLLLWLPLVATAATYQALPNVSITVPDLPASWQVTTEPTEQMVEHLAEHVQKAFRGMLSDEEAIQAARGRLAKEELIFFNEKSEAHILISFEARGDDESAPTKNDLMLSAKYAASGVEEEGWRDVNVRFLDANVKGAQVVQRFAIDYNNEDGVGFFAGLIGYAEPFWFWVYANEHGKALADKEVINSILTNFEVRVK